MATKRVWKTRKKLSGGPKVFRPWKDWENGDWVIGEFTGDFHTDNYDKENPLIKVEECAFISDRKLAKSLPGKILCLNSAGQLNKAIEKAEKGDVLQITYNGTSTIEKGKYKGKDSHLIDVELLTEDDDSEEEELDEEQEEEETEEEETELEDEEDEDIDL